MTDDQFLEMCKSYDKGIKRLKQQIVRTAEKMNYAKHVNFSVDDLRTELLCFAAALEYFGYAVTWNFDGVMLRKLHIRSSTLKSHEVFEIGDTY